MLVCDKCKKEHLHGANVVNTKYVLKCNGNYVYQIHADYCNQCRDKINKKLIETMDKVAGF